MELTTAGLEVEVLLIDGRGYVVNMAPQILAHPDIKKGGYEWASPEATKVQIELHTKPTQTIAEQYDELRKNSERLQKICTEIDPDLTFICASEFGAGSHEINPGLTRLPFYNAIVREGQLPSMLSILGQHGHLGVRRLIDEYNVRTAIESVAFTATSTSPISFEGERTLHSHRIDVVRNTTFENMPELTSLPKYFASIAQMEARTKRNRARWAKRVEAAGMSRRNFYRLFGPDSTDFPPVRYKKGLGTTEGRSGESSPFQFGMAILAFEKGIVDYMNMKQTRVGFGSEFSFDVHENRIVLPPNSFLWRMQNYAMRYGVREPVKDLVVEALPMAERGLPLGDRKFLEPLQWALQGKTPAERLIDYMQQSFGEKRQFSIDERAQANLYMRILFEDFF